MRLYFPRFIEPIEMICYRAKGSIGTPSHFSFRERSSAIVATPMVKHGRNVTDTIQDSCVRASQGDIVILAAFKAFPETADALKQRAPVHPQWAYHVMTDKKLKVPIRFAVGQGSSALRIALVFV